MKSFIAGLIAFLIIGLLAFNSLRNRGIIDLENSPSPSPSSVANNWDMESETDPSPSLSPSTTPAPSPVTTTKGGVVLGQATPAPKTTTTTTTTTTKITRITALETNKCQLDATTYIRDIKSPLTFRYEVKNEMSAVISAWKVEGETVLQRTKVSGNGVLMTYDGKSDLKIRVESNDCENTSDNWFKLFAEK